MRKNLLALAAIPALLFAASCSNEDISVSPAGPDGSVTFTAQLPGTFSRAFSDGLKATQLSYAVYETGSNDVVLSSEDPSAPQASFSGLTATLSLQLVKGKTYDVIFWADVPGNTAYTFTPATKSVSIDYTGIASNDESRDAFFQVEKGMTINGAISKTVELRRPFAQINWGTDDLAVVEAAKTKIGGTTLTVSNAYSTLDLFTGVASDGNEITFSLSALPTGETFPVEGYEYLSMNYVLTGSVVETSDVQQAQKELVDCSLTVLDDKNKEINTLTLSNVPVQRNYRTNIFGSLLTSTVDYTIVIEPDFNTPHHAYDQLLLAAQTGGKVVLTEDLTMPSSTLKVTADMVLDLKGHNITFPESVGAPAWGLRADNGATLTINGEGTVTAGPNTMVLSSANGGNLIVNGGTFKAGTNNLGDGATECVYLHDSGSITINGGYFASETPREKSKIANPNCLDEGWFYVINKNNSATGTITVNGGQFENYNPAWGDDADKNPVSFLGKGISTLAKTVDGVTVYNAAKEQSVTTIEDLQEVLAQGGDAVIVEQFEITEPTTIALNGNITSSLGTVMSVRADLTIEGTGTITTDEKALWAFVVRDGANLTAKDINIVHKNRTDGVPVAIVKGGNITLDNVTVDSEFATVQSWDGGEGKIVANNCSFVSRSNTGYGRYSYCFNIGGGVEAELNNCFVEGVQGGVAASKGSKVTINSGTYTTVKNTEFPNAPVHYAVYVAQGAEVIINGGKFHSFDKADIFNGNNDNAGDPFGTLTLKGGIYTNQGYNQETKENFIKPAEGYVWEAVEGQDPYKWQIVKE